MIFEFRTGAYADPAAVMERHVNGMAGHALLTAICDGLVRAGFDPDPVDQEDWGWYTDFSSGMPYMVGALVYQDGDYGPGSGAPLDCLVQVWRTEPRRILGLIPSTRDVHAPLDDPVVARLDGIIRALDGVEAVRRSAE